MRFHWTLALSLLVGACGEERTEPFVALFCLDGASFDVIDDLRARGQLPTIDRLLREGASGPMESLAARRIMASSPRRGYWSPILWASLATGVVPEKHGIRDFLLPVPGTSQVWMGSSAEPARAELTLPEVRGTPPFLLRIRLRSHSPNGPQEIGITLNGDALARPIVPVEWETIAIPLPAEALAPGRNRLVFTPTKQSRPSETGDSNDHRLLAAELGGIEILDRERRLVLELDPVFARFRLGRDFYQPEAKVVEAQSTHLRARPLWSLAGEAGHPVGVVGYWTTWPAYPVNGFLVSSRMGLRGRRQGTTSELTWPPELASEIEPLYPSMEEMAPIFSRTHLAECSPPLLSESDAVADVLRQDELYFRAARELLPALDRGLFTVYFESIDVASHAYLHWREGAELRAGCPDSVRGIVDETYVQVDRWLGELVELLPENASVLVVSDHGLAPAASGGLHSPRGIFVASGPGVPPGRGIGRASVLDVAPTVLHLLGVPVPLEMDGKVLAPLFEQRWLSEHPPRYADRPVTDFSVEGEALTEGTEAVLERLRAIGYIE